MKRLIPFLFFISGATALIGEVVWMRMLGLVLGNTIWAASAAVTVWMVGMALGAAIGARFAPRIRRHILVYGLAEGGIGAFYAASPAALGSLLALGSHLGDDMGASLTLGIAQRFGLATIVLLPPTVLMGLTLPLLVERLQGDRLAERTGLLYGLNTLGAAAGVFFTAYWALPTMGETGALAAAAVLCLLVMVLSVVAERSIMPTAPERRTEVLERHGAAGFFLGLVALMGAAALAAELVWVRILVLHLGSRVYAFAILLGVYLLGLGLGSLAVKTLARGFTNPTRALALTQAAAALALVAQLAVLGHTSSILAGLASALKLSYSFFGVQSAFLLTVALLFLPVTVLFGASFPLAVAADPKPRSPGQHAGAVATANTLGAIVGAVGAPFLLVPLIGCQRTLLLLAVVHLIVALALWRTRTTTLVASAALVTVVLFGVMLPRDWVLRRAVEDISDTEVLVALEEDIGATIIVKEYGEPEARWLSLELNGTNVAGSSRALLKVQQLQGHLPLLQVENPREILHVGFGSGGTCWAVSHHPVERIDVVEISPRVLTASDHWFDFINHNVLDDSRVRTILNDGRNYLMATDKKYDAILSDSIHPVFAGNGALYTLEYFQMCRDRLKPGGVASMWLPVYSLDTESFLRILSAFRQVFPQTAVWYDRTTPNEFTIVTGRVETGPITIDWERLEDPNLTESLLIGGISSAADLEADLLLGPREVTALVAETEPHIDDLPFVEYTAGQTLDRTGTWYKNLALLASVRTRANPFAAPPVPFEEAAAIRDQALQKTLKAVLSHTIPGV
ncbi:MAG: fused MFS/spermidine synthase [Acidobacteriota bacterium]